jgi:cyclohexanone monooxygenase
MTDLAETTPGEQAFDADGLRERYARERDQREHPGRNEQWTAIADDLARFGDDPYVEPGFQRDPIEEDLEVLVIGGGFGGLLCAARLREAGVEDFRIVERAGDFGGTWYWNRYPGVQCDVESYIYLPLLEETGYVPTEKYAYGAEIREHTARIAERFGLYDRALFQTRVCEMRWDEDSRRWHVSTDRGDLIRARFVVSSSGPLNRPHLPGVPGIGDFKGKAFHTSRWDYGYTGGDSGGGLAKLADKRVAVIGTGATAIQCVPYVAEHAEQLYVFQRTPSVVGERGNRPTDLGWARSLEPGWQKRRSDNFELILEGGAPPEDLVADGWTILNKKMRPDGPLDQLTPQGRARQAELKDFAAGEDLRARVDQIVSNKQAAEGLKPWYRVFCKRPTFNDEYLPTFNRPNVTHVDTRGAGVERITEKGLVANGVEYEVDCIIFATGFDTGAEYTKRSEFELYGVGGRTLSEHHREGPRTLHGYYSHGFPNFFILGVSQNGFRANFTHMLAEQGAHIVHVIAELRRRGLTRAEPTAEAEAGWIEVIKARARDRVAFLSTCTPGYYNGQGDVERGIFVNVFNGGGNAFARLIGEWREAGEFAGLEVS